MNDCLDLAGKKIFVTGADGFIGSHLTQRLAELGAEVSALCCYNSQGNIGWLSDLSLNTLSQLEMVFGDVRDQSFMKGQLKNKDYIFHLASLISIPYSYSAGQSYLDVNVGGLLNILETLRNQSFTRLINTSTSEVYGTAQTRPIKENHPMCAQSPYSASKIAADHFIQAYVKSFDMPLCSLRPFNTYGPRQSSRAVIPTIISQLLDDNEPNLKLGDLSPRRDFNYISDTIDAFVNLMFCDKATYGEAYNAGSGKSISIKETIEIIEKIIGFKKPVIIDDHKLRPKNSEVMELIADYSELNVVSGWEPKVDLKQGLSLTVDWFRQSKQQTKILSRNIKFD